MVLQSSGPISFIDIQTEFTGANPISLSEYYANASTGYTTGISGIPNTGSSISMSQFYGKSSGVPNVSVNTPAYFAIASAPGLGGYASGITMSFWIRTSYAGLASIFYVAQSATRPGMEILMNNGLLTVNMYFYNSNAVSYTLSTSSIRDGTWKNVVIQIPYTQGSTITIHVNGVTAATSANIVLANIGLYNAASVAQNIYINSGTNGGIIGSFALFYLINTYSFNSVSQFYDSGKAVNIGNGVVSTLFGGSTPLIYLKGSGTNFGVNNGSIGNLAALNTSYISTDSVTFQYA